MLENLVLLVNFLCFALIYSWNVIHSIVLSLSLLKGGYVVVKDVCKLFILSNQIKILSVFKGNKNVEKLSVISDYAALYDIVLDCNYFRYWKLGMYINVYKCYCE